MTREWTDADWRAWLEGSDEAHRVALAKAADVLTGAAAAYEALPARVQRKLPFELSGAYLSNEADRARDILSLYARGER